MNIAVQARADIVWMISEQGEPVVYTPKIGAIVELLAIVDKNAVEPPEYGYEGKISQLHHQFTMLPDILGLTPKHGDKILYDETEYVVHQILPSDDDVVIVSAR